MEKLRPFEKLEDDYYMGDEARGGIGRDSEEELSSDDELQQELCKLAGIKKDCIQKRRKEKPVKSEFEMDMECELDQLITDYANEHLSGNVKRPEAPAISCQEFIKQCEEEEMPALVGDSDDDDEHDDGSKRTGMAKGGGEMAVPSKRVKLESPASRGKSSAIEEMETDAKVPSSTASVPDPVDISGTSPSVKKEFGSDPKKGSGFSNTAMEGEKEEENPIKKAAQQTIKDVKDAPDFYDPDEDDQNEKWMQQERKRRTGMDSGSKTVQEARPRIDGNSDAVLSCPGCMVMLTRDCQRHEIYGDQYRAMFVENCRIDQESMKVEKTGKEKRRERQKLRKMGLDPAVQSESSDDIFLPVRCAVCSTNVAVVDHEEVYHFFNVLSGYA